MALQKTPNVSAAELGAAMARSGTWFTPTLITQYNWRVLPDSQANRLIGDSTGASDPRNHYVSSALRAGWRSQMAMKALESPRDWAKLHRQEIEDFRAIHGAGAGVLAGTDLAAVLIYPGFSLHDELELMVSTGGMTPVQALESATRNPAAFFGIESDLGRIATNARADLVLLDANPLEDIRNTRKIRAVVAQGHLFDRTGLDSLLARVDRGVHGNGGSCEGSAK
jgi:hypothetical protein